MHKRNTLLYGIFISGVFLCLDQGLKWLSLHAWTERIIVGKWFGWYPFMNSGVAFGLPVPIVLVSVVTFPLVGVLVWLLVRAYRRDLQLQVLGFTSIIAGASSNLVDRLIHNQTVDYFLVFTGVINVADILIILGFILLFIALRDNRTAQ